MNKKGILTGIVLLLAAPAAYSEMIVDSYIDGNHHVIWLALIC